jgi:1-acyl-sn-glycerol-3-phosphate acyltransferase
MGALSILKKYIVKEDIAAQVNKIKKPVGSFGYDAWGYNVDTLKVGMGLFDKIYTNYFKVETYGIENVPADGRVLLIPNHSGQLPMDGVLIGMAMARRDKDPRATRAMIERFFPTVPFLGNMLNSIGAVIGDPINCARMLDNDEAIIVFPEGVRGSGKLYDKRYQLQRFGNGFMHLAVKHKAPIIPVGVVGCEETMPALYNIKPLADMLGVPYVPITTPVPLPAKVSLHFGKPMFFEEVATEEEVTAQVEQVKDEIRVLINEGLSKRESIF